MRTVLSTNHCQLNHTRINRSIKQNRLKYIQTVLSSRLWHIRQNLRQQRPISRHRWDMHHFIRRMGIFDGRPDGHDVKRRMTGLDQSTLKPCMNDLNLWRMT